ncbi:hypothetical protein A1704_23655 [Chryseobacterium cucumeris]|uniref:hypothetical protein n=1 Tax=Chryseobacterium cucumeris TaxID=1813611 RepID=UPI000786F087|nr:hypothetical protein [Chryseobacterium cucumeris]KYH06600.1 hypothetical protein A1704_23655 [Chryseobacterium cucumeris]
MKQILLLGTLLFSVDAFCQVGINTNTPHATLDIVGKPADTFAIDGVIVPRLTGDQLKTKDNLYTALQDGTIVYVTSPLTASQTTNKTVNVLEKGYYYFDISKGTGGQWLRMYYNYSGVLAGADGIDAYTGSGVTISAANNNTTTQLVTSRAFTLNQKSLVTFTYTLSVSDIVAADGSFISDNRSKLYGSGLYWINGGGIFTNNTSLSVQSTNFSSSPNYANGFFHLSSTRSVVLPAGTYSVGLQAIVFAALNDNIGIRATFGTGSRDILDIIAVPFPN